MQVETIKTSWLDGELKQNTHIAIINDKCFIIDAGAKLEKILELTKDKKVEAILITHCHYDHISHIKEYDDYFSCPIYIQENGKEFLLNPELNLSSLFQSPISFSLKNAVYIKGNEDININGIKITCLYTPGHTRDSLCFLFPDKTIFSGDTFFAKAVGATHFLTGNPQELVGSLQRLLNVDFKNAYTGHMRKTTKEEQLQNIPYFIKELNYYSF